MSDIVNGNTGTNANYILQQYIAAKGEDAASVGDAANEQNKFDDAVNSWFSDDNSQDKENPFLFLNHVAKGLGLGDEKTEENAKYWDALEQAIIEVSSLDGDVQSITMDDLSEPAISVQNVIKETDSKAEPAVSDKNDINKFLNDFISREKDTYTKLSIGDVAADLFAIGAISGEQYLQATEAMPASGDDAQQMEIESGKLELTMLSFLEDAFFTLDDIDHEGNFSVEYITQIATDLLNNDLLSEEDYNRLLAKLPSQVPDEQPAVEDASDSAAKSTTEIMAQQFASSTGADPAEFNEKITNFISANGLSFASAQALADELGISVEPVQNFISQMIMNIGAEMDTVLSLEDVQDAPAVSPDKVETPAETSSKEETVSVQAEPKASDSAAKSTTEIMAQQFASSTGADPAEFNEKITNFISANGLSFASAQALADELGISVEPVQNFISQMIMNIGANMDTVLTLEDVQATDTSALSETMKADETVSPAAAVQQAQTVNMQARELYAAAHHVVDTNSWKRNDPNNAEWKDAKEQFAKALTGGADLSDCFDEEGNCTEEFTRYLQELADKYSNQINLHLAPREKVTAESAGEDILYAFMKNAVYGHSFENNFEITGMRAKAADTQQTADSTEKTEEIHNPFELKGRGWSKYNGCHYDAATGEAWLTGHWPSSDGMAIFTTPAQIIKHCYGVEQGDPDFDLIYNTLNELNGNRFTGPTEANGIGGQRINLMSFDAYQG